MTRDSIDNFKIGTLWVFTVKIFAQLYFADVKGWQFTFKEHLHDHIILPRGNGWAQLACLTPPLFIEVPIPSQKG